MLKWQAIAFAFAGTFLIFGLPGIPGDMRQFAEALGMPPAEWQWWNYLMVGGGVFGMLLFGYLMVMELRKRWTRKPPEWQLEKIKLINNWLEVPETAKRLIILRNSLV